MSSFKNTERIASRMITMNGGSIGTVKPKSKRKKKEYDIDGKLYTKEVADICLNCTEKVCKGFCERVKGL